MQVEEYQKRLEIAIALLGEEAGRRYMAGRVRENRRRFVQALQEEICRRLAGLASPVRLACKIELDQRGVRVTRLLRPRGR